LASINAGSLRKALAVGLGSRILVSRSLESHAERSNARIVTPHPPCPTIPFAISEQVRASEDKAVNDRSVPNETGKLNIPV